MYNYQNHLIEGFSYKKVCEKKSKKEFESVSILLNLILLWITFEVFTSSNWILPETSEPYLLVGMAGLFFINSIGNIMSKNKVEQFIFTPCALILAFFCAVIALG